MYKYCIYDIIQEFWKHCRKNYSDYISGKRKIFHICCWYHVDLGAVLWSDIIITLESLWILLRSVLQLSSPMEVLSKAISCLVFFCLVRAVTPVCSRCDGFEASSLAGNLTIVNRTLVGYELYDVDVEHIVYCVDACIEECRCMSFNFKWLQTQGGRHQCQLNSERKDTNMSALVVKPGHGYHDLQTKVRTTCNVLLATDLSMFSACSVERRIDI